MSGSYKIRHSRTRKHTAPLQRSPCRSHALGGRYWSRVRPLLRLSHQHGRTSPYWRAFRSSHMLPHAPYGRGGDHHCDSTRSCSRTGPALTAPLALQSSKTMYATLRPPGARQLDVVPIEVWSAAARSAALAMSVGGSVGSMGGAHIRSGHAYLMYLHRYLQW